MTLTLTPTLTLTLTLINPNPNQVRSHDFFRAVDWSTPLWQQPSVYTPTLAAPTDTSNFQMNALARVQADRCSSICGGSSSISVSSSSVAA